MLNNDYMLRAHEILVLTLKFPQPSNINKKPLSCLVKNWVLGNKKLLSKLYIQFDGQVSMLDLEIF